MTSRWMVCSACRKEIPFSGSYYACSVSTCNRAATRLVFCSVACWDSHLAVLRHRDAWAVEERAPAFAASPSAAPAIAQPPVAAAPRVTAPPPASAPAPAPASASPLTLSPADDTDILIVVSKLKKYIRDRSGMNTADAVAERLSHHVRAICDAAIFAAAHDNRKTVLDRDVPPIRHS